MKKIFLSVVVLAMTVVAANAQVRFGIKAGVNNSTLGGDAADFDGKKSNTGFNAGVYTNIPFSEHFSFQPELMYSANEGFEYRPNTNTELNYNLSYVNVPLMVQFKSDKGIYGEAGPYVGFLVSAKEKLNVGGTKTESDVKNSFKGTDLGAGLGIGYISKSGLGIGARYNMGLANIYDGNAEYKNRFWQFNLTYLLKHKSMSADKK